MQKTGSHRVERCEQEVRLQIATFLISGFKHPLPGFVTVTRVLMPADLRSAKVYVSVFGEKPTAKEECIELLQKYAHEVQGFLAKNVRSRYCPKLTFFSDDRTEQIIAVEKAIEEMKTKDEDDVE
jgi:ribosome-binding factor A